MRSSQLENKIINIIEKYGLNSADDMEIYYFYINEEIYIRFGIKSFSFQNSFFSNIFWDKDYRIQNNISPFGSVERVIRKLHNKRPDLFNLLDEKLNKTEDYIKYNQGYEVEL